MPSTRHPLDRTTPEILKKKVVFMIFWWLRVEAEQELSGVAPGRASF
jgi:hypothetical protein